MSIEFLESHFDKVSYLQNFLSARATGNAADPSEYLELRHQLLSDAVTTPYNDASLDRFVFLQVV